ncbi:MAG TPA: ABC transporter substrate-binding protein [Thermoanaerobaculia bacterium]|nr:ABC transporter substrate-binding protein [Thermoanaerobaculia bacterium]
MRVGVLTPISELDPRKAVDYVSGMILDQIFETPSTLLEPLRAEDRKSLEYSAAVRPGALFSDGTPLTADLVVRSLRESSVLAGKATVALKEGRVWFTLSAPNPRFDLTLTHSSCAIVLPQRGQLLGTGPYMFAAPPSLAALQRARTLTLVRNPHHSGAAGANEIEFHVLLPEKDGTPRALVDALANGGIDVTTALSAGDLTTWKLTGVVPVTRPSNSTAFLYMNTSQRPLDTREARSAIATLIDPLEIASKTYDRNPAAFAATGALPPAMSRAATLRTQSFDGAALVRSSGLQGARLTLLVPWAPRPYLLKPVAAAEAIQRKLNAAGMNVALTHTTSGDEYFSRLTNGGFDLALGGWIADTVDPADYFDALLASQAVGDWNLANHSRWNDGATDALLAQYRMDPSDANRRELERIIADDAPFVPLVYGQLCVIHNRRFRNATLSPTGTISLAAMTAA